jgi:hypothetical protein
MRRTFFLVFAVILAFAHGTVGQDDGELRIKKALEGRMVLIKMDMPAVETGLDMIFDDAAVSYDEKNYKRLLKEYGVALKNGSRAKITAVRITRKGIEIDLNGGGSPGREWIVGGLRLVEPTPVAKSDRELELERQILGESSGTTVSYLRNELDYERQRRLNQDERNLQAYERVAHVRTDYIEKNRKNWGSKLIIVVRSRKQTVTLRDMTKSLAKYLELLPREPIGE